MSFQSYLVDLTKYASAKSPTVALSKLLGMLRALKWNYWNSHWLVQGIPYYGDHTLFDRLYSETIDKQIDTLAEKLVNLGPELADSKLLRASFNEFLERHEDESNPFKRGLAMEKEVMTFITKTYKDLKEKDLLSLGMDDFLMSIANDRETVIYLLTQRSRYPSQDMPKQANARAVGTSIAERLSMFTKGAPQAAPKVAEGFVSHITPQNTRMPALDKLRESVNASKMVQSTPKNVPAITPAKINPNNTVSQAEGFNTRMQEIMDRYNQQKSTLSQNFQQEMGKIKTSSVVAEKTDPQLWEQSKSEAKSKMGGKHSARAMQLATQIYKKKGGGYSGAKPTTKNNSLKKWTEQDWQWSKEKKASEGKGVYLPAAKIERLKSSPEGLKKLQSAERKKAIATNKGEQYSSHGLAANTSLQKSAFDEKAVAKIVEQLKKSVVTHKKQADTLSKMLSKNMTKEAAAKFLGEALILKLLGKKGIPLAEKYNNLGSGLKKYLLRDIPGTEGFHMIKDPAKRDMAATAMSHPEVFVQVALPGTPIHMPLTEMAKKKMKGVDDIKKELKLLEEKAKDVPSISSVSSLSKQASVEYMGKTFPGYNKPIPSDKKDKKKMVLVKRGDKVKLIHFGQKGYEDYTQHHSKERRKNYLTRSAGIRDKNGNLTKDNPFSPNYWARKELW